MEIKLSNEKLRYIALFEKLTGVTPKDCVETEKSDRLTYVVDEKDMGKAIGENGRNIQKVRNKLEKNVHVVQYSNDPKKFLENIFSPVEIENIEFDEENGQKTALVEVKDSEKGRAVGRNGWNIERARRLSNRHHGMADVSFV